MNSTIHILVLRNQTPERRGRRRPNPAEGDRSHAFAIPEVREVRPPAPSPKAQELW